MDLARNGFSDNQIRDALHGRSGRQKYRFRYELQENGARIRDLKVDDASVSLNHNDSIQRSASLTVYDDRIDWLKNTIKIFMGIEVQKRWVEWPLGVFIPSTPTKVTESIKNKQLYKESFSEESFFDFDWSEIEDYTWDNLDSGIVRTRTLISSELRESARYEVECYDMSVILKEDTFVTRHFIPTGTKYLTAVQNILVVAGIARVTITKEINTELPFEREWEIGKSKLEIINTLLEEINYNKIFFDADGVAIISPYIEPTVSEITYTYAVGEMSIIMPELSTTKDFYSVPNVFIATSSNPDAKQDYTAKYVNESADSPLSTIQRGRSIVSKPYKLDAVASQLELDEYVRRMAFEASQVYEEIEFTTALIPVHGSGSVLELIHPAATGIFQETAWEMSLSAGGEMSHTARRLAKIE